MSEAPDLETFWRSHKMCRSLAQAAIDLIGELTPDVRNGPPLVDARLEKFRRAVAEIHAATFPKVRN